jgi:hypothetical protein
MYMFIADFVRLAKEKRIYHLRQTGPETGYDKELPELTNQMRALLLDPSYAQYDTAEVKELVDSGRLVDGMPLSMPFKVTYLELLEDGVFNFSSIYQKAPFAFFGVLIHELSVGIYDYYLVPQLDNQNAQIAMTRLGIMKISSDEGLGKALTKWFAVVFAKLAASKDQMTGEVHQVKFKSNIGGNKKAVTFNKVVYVSTKNKFTTVTPPIHKKINWSHIWEVRAHWRSIPEKLGHDREGNYGVAGFTWVKNHIRGEGELVIKTRIAKGA